MGILKRWGGEQVGWEIIGMGASPSSTDITGVSSVAGKVGDVILDANDVKYDDSITYDDTSIGYKIQQTLTVAEAVIVNLNTPYADVRNAVATNRVVFCDVNNVRHYLSSVSQETGTITFIADTGAETSIVTYQDGVAASHITNRASTVFKAVYGTTTNAQIYAAKNQGNSCIVEYEGYNYVLAQCSSVYANFIIIGLPPEGLTCKMVVCNNNDWHTATGAAPYMGTFNALSSTVSSHTTTINSVESSVTALSSAVTGHTSQISAANTSIAAITSKANTNAANITTVTNTVNNIYGKTLDKIYPVGAIYISTVSTSPASLFGGSWTRITGQFLLGASDSNGAANSYQKTAGTTNSNTPSITTNYLPSHAHNIYVKQFKVTTGTTSIHTVGTSSNYDDNYGSILATSSGSNTLNVSPSYLAVYMWKRTG